MAWLTDSTGLGANELSLSIWGDPGDFPGLLLSATLPSGAVAVVGSCGTAANSALGLLQLYPAGTDPAELLFVMPCPTLSEGVPGSTVGYLVMVGPIGTASLMIDMPGGSSVSAEGRMVVFNDVIPSETDVYQALDRNGQYLALAPLGTVIDLFDPELGS